MTINYAKRVSLGLHLILMLWCSFPIFSQVKMVKDINQTSGNGDPNSFFALGNRLFFVADDHARKKDLWVTDGTTAGTQFFKMIGGGRFTSQPRLFTKVGDKVFFVAYNALFVTDGTVEGTKLLKQLNSVFGKAPRYLTEMGGKLYFYLIDEPDGGLWVSDGTVEGTKLVKEVPIGFNELPNQMVALGDKIYFVGYEESTGIELWESDGTEAGTKIVKDITPGSSWTVIYDLEVAGDKMYFSSWDELWESDGTEAGTKMLVDLNDSSLGLTGYNLSNFTKLGSKILFSGVEKLWVSDLTPDGTTELAEYKGILSRNLDAIVVLGNQAFFTINDVTNGKELWVTDGTKAGTKMLKDINPGAEGSNPSELLISNNKLYFSATTASHGTELWQSDGTEAGTVMVKDIYNGVGNGAPSQFFTWNNKIYFQAKDAQHGVELWVSDGTEVGTNLLKDLYVNTIDGYKGSSFFYNNQLLLVANDGTGGNLWTTDGTEANTTKITNLGSRQASWLGAPIEFNGKLYFEASDATHGRELWVSDGTEARTQLLKDVNPGKEDSAPRDFFIFKGRLYFWAITSSGLKQIWSTDGTEAGTSAIGRFRSSNYFTRDNSVIIWGDKFYFVADGSSDSEGRELWVSDGTEAGTTRLTQSSHFRSSSPTGLTLYNNKLYFFAFSDANSFGQDLWVSDGTEAGTNKLVSLNRFTSNVDALIEFNGKLFFWAEYFLWETDGTANGTKKIKDLEGSAATAVYVWQGKLYFALYNNMWVSDGTEAGTYILADDKELRWGKDFFEYDNKLYFSAENTAQGRELWYTDGTSAGTQLAVDIFPGLRSSNPTGFKVWNNKLFLAANSGNGTELHVYQPLPRNLGTLSFSPKYGKPGDEVTITGISFETTPANNVVRFNQANATVIAATTSELKVTVPESATTGKITVQNNQQVATSADDFLISLTSLPQDLQGATLTLFPNPTAHTLKLQLTGKAANQVSLTAYNMLGTSVLQTTQTLRDGAMSIEVSGLPAGKYILKIQVGEEVVSRSILKE